MPPASRARAGRHRGLVRLLKYTAVGVTTFLFDLLLLYLFSDHLGMHYALATPLAFGIAISVNYFVSRRFVFRGTLRSVHAGYGIFILIAAVGMAAVTGLMVLFVEVLRLPYLPARVIVAGIVGLWNYLMNLYVNFKVAGRG